MTLTSYRASPAGRDAGGTVRTAVGAEDKTGPDAGHAPRCRMRRRPWILPPDALAIQPGGPPEASAGHGARTPSRSAKAHGAGS